MVKAVAVEIAEKLKKLEEYPGFVLLTDAGPPHKETVYCGYLTFLHGDDSHRVYDRCLDTVIDEVFQMYECEMRAMCSRIERTKLRIR